MRRFFSGRPAATQAQAKDIFVEIRDKKGPYLTVVFSGLSEECLTYLRNRFDYSASFAQCDELVNYAITVSLVGQAIELTSTVEGIRNSMKYIDRKEIQSLVLGKLETSITEIEEPEKRGDNETNGTYQNHC